MVAGVLVIFIWFGDFVIIDIVDSSK